MNETRRSERATERHEDGNDDRQKWAEAIQNLVRIIERSEQKLGYFQNRVKQAKFMDRPNQRMIRAAGAQVGAHTEHLEGLKNELRNLERLHSGGIRLRNALESELRQIWGWINRPGTREHLYPKQVSFAAFLNDWRGWTQHRHTHPLAMELRHTKQLIGFVLLRLEADTATVRFIGVRPDYRARGYGTDAVCETLAYAFQRLNAEQISLQVAPENGPALICFENAGFRYLGFSDTHGDEPLYTMGMERSEWTGEHTANAETDETTATPRLSVPLSTFFRSED